MAGINIGGELVPKTMAKKVAKAEYVYDPNQGGKRQSEINEELYQSKDVLPFDRIITQELISIHATTDQTPNAIVYASFYKRFLAVVGTGASAAYYYAWPNYEKYTDITNNNKPYGNKVYLSGGRTCVWNGTDLVAGGEQIQSDWNQTNPEAKDFIKHKPTIPIVPTNVSAFTNDAHYVNEQVFSQTIAGKADKSEMDIVEGAPGSPEEGKATITLKQGTSATVLTKHQDISGKANTTDVYPKTETYNKNEINSMITTPNQEYVTVTATAQTTDVTDLLPTTGAADTVYRVGCWDGAQYDDTCYSEYAWKGDAYVKLSTKNVGIDDEPTVGSNNVVKSGGVADVAGTYEDDPEFIELKLDGLRRFLEGIRVNGNKVFGASVEANGFIGKEVELDNVTFKTVDYPDYLSLALDSEGRVIVGIKTNGDVFFGAGVPNQIKEYVIQAIKDAGGEVIDFYHIIDDPEGRLEMEVDATNKIVAYRKKDGTKVENVGIETPFAKIDILNVRELNIGGIPSASNATSVYLERPKFAEFRFYGALPTDMSDARIPTTLDFLYRVNGQTLFSSKCTLAIQGHGSKNYPKQGYTFEPINADGDNIEIKWGDMIAVDSYHLKAYYSDRTHSRGVGGAKVWRNMIEHLPYPYNKVNNKALNIEIGQKIDAFCIADAKYSEDGFPFAFYLNDEFYGLYTLKLKKNRKNYGMEKSNKNEIFLDCLGYDVSVGHSGRLDDPFDAGAWDLKNPKLKNYEEGGEITDAAVLANIERLFTFTNNITTMYNQYEYYIVLPHWLTWFIHCELIGDVDKNGNNLELATWDGTHWSILPYDMDLTVGCYGGGNIQTTKSGYILTPTFYQNFRSVYEYEIKQLYTKLRKSGCIEINNIYKMYLGQIDSIPRFVYENDLKKWPNGIWLDNEFPVLEQIYSYLNSRIEYLDTVWLLSE